MGAIEHVYPDNGFTTLGRHLIAAEKAGFEVRDLECLREHYLRTCMEWLRRIEENERGLVEKSSRSTQRIFMLYVAAQTYYFKARVNSVHQTLLANIESKPALISLTRASWYTFQGATPTEYRAARPALPKRRSSRGGQHCKIERWQGTARITRYPQNGRSWRLDSSGEAAVKSSGAIRRWKPFRCGGVRLLK